MIKDVVCRMEVDEKKTIIKSFYNNKTYYFCSVNCKHKFDKNPEMSLK